MNLISSSDVIHFYKYHLKEFYIIFSDGSYKVDNNRLCDITEMDAYLDNLYPILKVTVAFEPSIYYKLVKEKDTLKIKLNIQKYYRVNDKGDKSAYSKFISDTFQLILNDDDENLSKDIHDKEFPDGDENELNAITIKQELFLFKKFVIKTNKTMINKVFENMTPTGGLSYLLSQLEINNILMDRLDNHTSYDFFYMPPLPINKEIKFIDTFYGFHKTGSVIFFGLSRSYILRFSTKTNAFEKGEIKDVCFIVPKEGSSITDSYAMLHKKNVKDKKYVLINPSDFKPSNPDRSDSIISPEVVEIVSPTAGELRQTGAAKTNKKVIVAKGVNPYYESIYDTYVTSGESEITVNAKDVDVSIFEPNKHYSFLFEDTSLAKKYKGKYFLCNKKILLMRDGMDFTAEVELVLRKV